MYVSLLHVYLLRFDLIAFSQLTVSGMKHPDERVALQAIEFWSTVCEEEVDLVLESQEVEYLLPILVRRLTEEIFRHKSMGMSLKPSRGSLLNPFFLTLSLFFCNCLLSKRKTQRKMSGMLLWHRVPAYHREAAIMTFGSIFEGPDPAVLTPLVNQALPLLIDMMGDANPHVKDTTAWTLGRICDLVATIRPDIHLHPLISALVNGLQDTPRMIANCCWALMNLADQYGLYFEEESELAQSGPLSPYYEGVVQALLRVTER